MSDDLWEYVQRGEPDQAASGGRAKRASPGPGETLRLILLDRALYKVWTHYYGGRTQPCLGALCPCVTSLVPMRKRWAGYAMAVDQQTRRLVIAHVTEEAYRNCPELQDAKADLRGALVTLTRMGTRANSPVRATCELHYRKRVPSSPLPLQRALERMWWGEHDGPVPLPLPGGNANPDDQSAAFGLDE